MKRDAVNLLQLGIEIGASRRPARVRLSLTAGSLFPELVGYVMGMAARITT